MPSGSPWPNTSWPIFSALSGASPSKKGRTAAFPPTVPLSPAPALRRSVNWRNLLPYIYITNRYHGPIQHLHGPLCVISQTLSCGRFAGFGHFSSLLVAFNNSSPARILNEWLSLFFYDRVVDIKLFVLRIMLRKQHWSQDWSWFADIAARFILIHKRLLITHCDFSARSVLLWRNVP